MPNQSFQHSLLRFIQAVGVWTVACLVLGFLILAVTYIRAGSIISSDATELANRSERQLLLGERISKNVLATEIALRTDDWNALKPVLAELHKDHTLWNDSHDSLRSNSQNKFSKDTDQRSIQEYFDLLDYPHSQISQSLDEIEIVTQSIIRRAPYIDQKSHDRIVAAVDSLLKHEAGFQATMGEITKLYQLNATTDSKNAISGVRSSLVFLLATLTLTLAIGVAPRYWFLVAQSIMLNNDLERAQEAADKRWRILASLGREFHAPISTITGLADILASDEQDKATKEELACSILDSGSGLMSLIEDIIDMADIEADELVTHLAPTAPDKVFGDLEPSFKALAKENGLELYTFFDDSCPASITTDEKRLKQIITKIVHNAIEFTNTGSVELHAALEKVEGKDMFIIRVVDTGIGVDSKDSNRIFEPFERVQTDTSRDHGGAGLGLTVARALTRQLGGDLKLESALGAGSFVTITIDPGQYIARSNAEQSIQEAVIDHDILDSKCILVIEDGKDNQRLLSHYLTKSGCSIQIAETGQLGIDRYSASLDAGRPFDLILMDMQMPDMDGFETTAILRKNNATVPILGVTTHCPENNHQRCLDSGCDDSLTKPVEKQALLDCCSLWLTKYAQTNKQEDHQPKEAA